MFIKHQSNVIDYSHKIFVMNHRVRFNTNSNRIHIPIGRKSQLYYYYYRFVASFSNWKKVCKSLFICNLILLFVFHFSSAMWNRLIPKKNSVYLRSAWWWMEYFLPKAHKPNLKYDECKILN